MCDCDVYLAYDQCECPPTGGHDTGYVRMLQNAMAMMREQLEHAKKLLEDQKIRHKKKVTEYQKERVTLKKEKELTEVALKSKDERVKKLQQQLKDAVKRHEEQLAAIRKNHRIDLQEKDEEMAGSRTMLRELNKATMQQIHMLRQENEHLKKMVAGKICSPEVELMSKCELRKRISQLEMEAVEREEQLDNTERMLNSAALANQVLRQELSNLKK